jgi:hypothetical protein
VTDRPAIRVDQVQRIVAEAARWGIEIVENNLPFRSGKYDPRFLCPPNAYDESVAIHWEHARIFYSWDGIWRPKALDELPMMLLHELAHTLQPVVPSEVDEIDSGMLWLEFITARRLGLMSLWSDWMEDYSLGNYAKCYVRSDWSQASYRERQCALVASRKGAVLGGLIKGNGHLSYSPLESVRRRIACGKE